AFHTAVRCVGVRADRLGAPRASGERIGRYRAVAVNAHSMPERVVFALGRVANEARIGIEPPRDVAGELHRGSPHDPRPSGWKQNHSSDLKRTELKVAERRGCCKRLLCCWSAGFSRVKRRTG